MANLLKKSLSQVKICLILLLGACSLSYKTKFLKSKSYSIDLPSKWQQIPAETADKAFRDNEGNIVFYNTICKKHLQKEVKILQRNLFQGISNLKVINKEKVKVYKREAIRTIATGRVDGVKVSIISTIFNRNYCTYDVAFVSPNLKKMKQHTANFKSLEKSFQFKD